MDFRVANESDLLALRELLDAQHALHEELLPTLFQFRPVTDVEILEIIESPDKDFLVAEEHDELLGLILVEQKTTKDIPIIVKKNYVYIQEMFVAESRRSEGIGRKLMAEAKRWSSEREIQILRTSVVAQNLNAISFYEREGFIPFMLNIELDLGQDGKELSNSRIHPVNVSSWSKHCEKGS